MDEDQKLWLTCAILFGLASAVLWAVLYVGFWPGAGDRTQRAQGTVLHRISRTAKGDKHYAFIVEFSPPQGPAVQFETVDVGSTTFEPGERVDVSYASGGADGARLADWRGVVTFLSCLLLLMSLLCLFPAVYVLRNWRSYYETFRRPRVREGGHRRSRPVPAKTLRVHLFEKDREILIGAGIMFAVSVLLAVAMAPRTYLGWQLFQHGRSAPAVIVKEGSRCRLGDHWVESSEMPNAPGVSTCRDYVVVEVRETDGDKRELKLADVRTASSFLMGGQLDVRYLPDRNSAVEDGIEGMFFGPIVGNFIALLLAGCSWLILKFGETGE